MVANKVQDNQVLLTRAFSKTTPQLLKKQNLRLSGAEHHYRVDVGHVNPFIEQVHGEDDREVSISQAIYSLGASKIRSGIDGGSFDSSFVELGGHVLRVGD